MSEKFNIEVKKIIKHIEDEKKFSKELLLSFMKSLNIEVLGAIIYIFGQRKALIEEYPHMDDILELYLNFYKRCFVESPEGEFTDGRFVQGYDFCSFYKSIHNDDRIPSAWKTRFRNMLRDVYLNGDAEIRDCIINAVLEHLFEEKNIRNSFSDWKNDESLKNAYKLAADWTDGKSDADSGKL